MSENEAMVYALQTLAHKAQYWADGDYSMPLLEDPKDNRLVLQAFEKLAQELDERAEKVEQSLST